MTIFGAGGSAFPPPEWVARNGAWLDSLTVARDPEPGSDPGSADGTAGKVYTFDNMTAESAARQLDRIRRQQDLKAQARKTASLRKLRHHIRHERGVRTSGNVGRKFAFQKSLSGTEVPYR